MATLPPRRGVGVAVPVSRDAGTGRGAVAGRARPALRSRRISPAVADDLGGGDARRAPEDGQRSEDQGRDHGTAEVPRQARVSARPGPCRRASWDRRRPGRPAEAGQGPSTAVRWRRARPDPQRRGGRPRRPGRREPSDDRAAAVAQHRGVRAAAPSARSRYSVRPPRPPGRPRTRPAEARAARGAPSPAAAGRAPSTGSDMPRSRWPRRRPATGCGAPAPACSAGRQQLRIGRQATCAHVTVAPARDAAAARGGSRGPGSSSSRCPAAALPDRQSPGRTGTAAQRHRQSTADAGDQLARARTADSPSCRSARPQIATLSAAGRPEHGGHSQYRRAASSARYQQRTLGRDPAQLAAATDRRQRCIPPTGDANDPPAAPARDHYGASGQPKDRENRARAA